MDSTSLIADTASRILRDHCQPEVINRAQGQAWQAPAWAALEAAGLTVAWVPEALGGAGADIADGFAVLRVAGRQAVALPVAETLLAGWLLSQSGIAVPAGAMTCAPTRQGDTITLTANGCLRGQVPKVPFARAAAHLALVAAGADGASVNLVDRGKVKVVEGKSIAGDALDTVILEDVRPLARQPLPARLLAGGLLTMGAAARAMQMSGALEAILNIAVSYANERVAFERPIAKFQAVQHNLARLAGETAAAMAAAGSAAAAVADWHAADHGSGGEADAALLLEVAAAKIRVGEAAAEGAGIAHQVLGAIGFTREHVLHRFTQRLWAWRDDFGNESAWAVRLGTLVAARGSDGLWPLLASR